MVPGAAMIVVAAMIVIVMTVDLRILAVLQCLRGHEEVSPMISLPVEMATVMVTPVVMMIVVVVAMKDLVAVMVVVAVVVMTVTVVIGNAQILVSLRHLGM
jgi:hypothetical protein